MTTFTTLGERLPVTLDAMQRRAVASSLRQLSLLGWRLSHPETGALVDPAILATHIETRRSRLLVEIGEGGTVDPSPALIPPEGGTPDDHLDPDEELS